MGLKKKIKKFLKRGKFKGYKIVSFEYKKVKKSNEITIVFKVSNEKKFGKSGWIDIGKIQVPISALKREYVNFCNYNYCFLKQYDLDGTKR